MELMKAYCKRLEDARVDARMAVYKNSYHSFDDSGHSEEPEVVNFPVLSMKKAGIAYKRRQNTRKNYLIPFVG